MDKKELVGKLLTEGKISDEEAIILLSIQEQEQELAIIIDPIVDPIEVKLDKLLDNQFTEDLFSYSPSDVTNLNDIINFMRDTDRKWLGEEVTHSRFKSEVIFNIKQALIQLIEDYKEHNVPKDELHTFCESGGIRVDCIVTDIDASCDEYMVNIEVRYTVGNWISDIKLNDII